MLEHTHQEIVSLPEITSQHSFTVPFKETRRSSTKSIIMDINVASLPEDTKFLSVNWRIQFV